MHYLYLKSSTLYTQTFKCMLRIFSVFGIIFWEGFKINFSETA